MNSILRLCKCGCGQTFIHVYKYYEKQYVKGHNNIFKKFNSDPAMIARQQATKRKKKIKSKENFVNSILRLCACGCGQTFIPKKHNNYRTTYIHGHCRTGFFKEGPDSRWWKGGVTPLHLLIKESNQSLRWKRLVFERDNYICQDCGKSNCYIEAHHIKTFSKLLEDFISKYSMFSPVEDKEVLAKLSDIHEPFWDISNGQTLCEDCHKLTDTYGRHNKAKKKKCYNLIRY